MDRQNVQILRRLEKALDTLEFRWALRLLDPKDEGIDWNRVGRAGDTLTRLKIYAMTAESYDYVGKYDEARKAVETEGIKSERIFRGKPKKNDDRSLLKQRVWILIHWSMSFYRAHDYKRARQLLLLCNEVLSKRILTDSDPCAFTQSRIYYCLGLVERQEYDYKSGRYWFAKSIEMAWESFVRKTQKVPVTDQIHKRTRIITGFYVAKSLALGLAWTYYTEGALELASSLAGTARLLLVETNEVVIRSYIEILSASILSAQGKRKEAIDILNEAYSVLKEHKHDAYRIRAANELAVAYVHEYVREPSLENRTRAQKYIDEVKTSSDVRWKSNALINESRLFRALGDFQAAEGSARDAFRLGGEQRFVRIDALIALGEARLGLNKIDEACKNFTDALMEGMDNRKVQAVCHLHLARAYLLKGDLGFAHRHRVEAARDLAHVDNVFVSRLAEAVENMIEQKSGAEAAESIKQATGADFYIPFSAGALNAWELEKSLHVFLAKWAKHKAGSDNEPWKLLGISKQTFYNWKPNGERSRESIESEKDERQE